MDDKQAPEVIATLTLRVLAMRDVLARLLAYEALRHERSEDLLRDFSEATETRIAHVSSARKPSMMAEEGIRKEIDWIVAAARKMLPDDRGS
jgi:hypothetical protein